jgi:predicted HTH transcriptional regulator
MFTTEESDILVDIIKLYDVKEYSILFTKEPSYIINPKLRKYIVRQRNVFNYDNLKLLVLNRRSKAIRHNHQHVPNDKKLFRVTNIYFRLLSKEPNITTQVLCDDFGVSAKTIHRDIDMLIQFGNEISYDKQLKSWVMGHSIYKIDFEFEYAKKELEKEKR